MATSDSYWTSMSDNHVAWLGDTTKRALLDELIKIAEEVPKQKGGIGKALRTMGVGAGGLALGYGLSELVVRKMPFFNIPPHLPPDVAQKLLAQRATTRKIILPILSGVAVMLADRYRQKMNDEYGQVQGFNGKNA